MTRLFARERLELAQVLQVAGINGIRTESRQRRAQAKAEEPATTKF
jgi:hypothetical protein